MPPASVKLAPPRVPPWYVPRGELERRLDEAAAYRLTSVVAGAGYGKSTHLAARAAVNGWAWYTVDGGDGSALALAQGLLGAVGRRTGGADADFVPSAGGDAREGADVLAAAISAQLEETLSDDMVLVVDDVHELGSTPAVGLLESLLRYAPPKLHLVLASRHEPPFGIARMRGRGDVLDIGPVDLSFGVDEIAVLLSGRMGDSAAELAAPLHEISGGWPAAVRLGAEVLASVSEGDRWDVFRAVSRQRTPLFTYLAEEVFAREPPEMRQLLSAAAHFDRVTPELCAALGVVDSEPLLADLARRGLAVEATDGSYTIHDLVREFARTNWDATPAEIRELHRRAAEWLESQARSAEALEAAVAAGDGPLVVRLLKLHARALNEQGFTELVVRASTVVPRELRSTTIPGAVSHALILRGDLTRAEEWLSVFEQKVAGTLFARDVAVQRSLIHINRGDSVGALEALERAGPQPGAFIEAFMSYQLLSVGREEEAERLAALALEHAEDEGTAATPYAEALMACGEVDRARGDVASAEERFRSAVEVAEEIGNVLAACSARRRLVVTRAERGQLEQALADTAIALEQADRTGVFEFQGSTRTGRGVVHFALGRLDEAEEDFLSAVEVYERLGSTWMAAPLIGLGDVHRERGEPAEARSAYERALAVGERGGHVAHEIAAAAGLARVLVDEDREQAGALLERARSKATPRHELLLALAEGWIAVALRDRGRATRMAEAAAREATRLGTPAAMADALELRCFASPEPRLAADALREALAIWRRIGASLRAACALLGLASIGGDVAEAEVAEARRTLQHAGVRLPGIGAGMAAVIALDRPPPLEIETLGRFAVLRDGVPVPSSQWQSKKARDLLKLLITRRGKTAPRDFLIEALWPDEDPRKTSNRLSVALNVVRGVLDPQGHFEVDRFVAGDRDGVRLELANVAVDLEAFLEQAVTGLRASAHGEADAAQPLLESAEATYRGDFLEEDAYDDWAIPLRDEARATYLEVARALALGEPATTRYHLRILALDPYDEDTHLDLVSRLAGSGQHGEARRAYRRYVQRMGEIGVEPAGFPDRPAGQRD
jgi:ATP/maltotriose-dependent transcriptional regulator MalT/DNA-binding SARP family transcriptional activator